QRGMVTRAAEFLGADMRLSSRDPWPDEVLQEAIKNNLQHTDIVDFSSITSSETEILLSSIKAVWPGYPLRGEVRISDEPHGSERTVTAMPEPGTVWVEARLLSQLDMQVADLHVQLAQQPGHAGRRPAGSGLCPVTGGRGTDP